MRVIVFGEAFVCGYPDWTWRTNPWNDDRWFVRLLDQAVVVPSPATDRLGEAARRAGAYVAIGIDERDPHGSTIYNSLLYLGPDGARPRRAPQAHADGWRAPRVGRRRRVGARCARDAVRPARRAALLGELHAARARAVYAQGIDVYVAPTWDNSDAWVSTLRHIAKEGRIHVIGVSPCQRGSDVRDAFEGLDALYGGDDDWLSRGNATIVGPEGGHPRRPARR